MSDMVSGAVQWQEVIEMDKDIRQEIGK
jgi:hypothetical protein